MHEISNNVICDAFCDFGACGGTTSSAEKVTLNDVDKFDWRRTLFGKRTLATFNNKQTFLPLQKCTTISLRIGTDLSLFISYIYKCALSFKH